MLFLQNELLMLRHRAQTPPKRLLSDCRRRAEPPPDLNTLKVPAFVQKLFKSAVVTLLERPSCNLPVNISIINDIMRASDR